MRNAHRVSSGTRRQKFAASRNEKAAFGTEGLDNPEGFEMEIEEQKSVTPICPHCERPQSTIHYRSLSAFLGRRYVYFCAECKKILGVSHRKGFWMG